LAEARSFTRAAAAIGLSQPTLSHQIRQLETALGAELFQRSRTGCRLTALGESLLPYVRRVLGEMEALRQTLDDQSALRRGSLIVATLPVLAERVMPRALAAFHAAHPGIRVRVLEMSVDEMAHTLTTGRVEVCVAPMEAPGSLRRGELLFEEELVAVVPAGSATGNEGSISVAELAARPVIVPPPGFGTRTMILQAWAKARRSPSFALEVSSTEAVLQAVVRGGGIGIVPASALWGRWPDGWAVAQIVRPVLRRQIGVLYAQVGSSRPAADALIPFLRDAVAEGLSDSPGTSAAVIPRRV
jgi:DNA-binding transcriptional LysR family regulator